METLEQRAAELTSDLIKKVVDHNTFLIEKGRILGISETIEDIKELKNTKED